MFFLLFAACSASKPPAGDDDSGTPATDDTAPTGGTTDSSPTDSSPPGDTCAPEAGSVATDPSCVVNTETVPFTPTLEWALDSFTDYPTHHRVIDAPVVGQLSDDDGDGQIGPGDTPDIAFISFAGDSTATADYPGVVRIVSGDGAGTVRSFAETPYADRTWWPYRYAHLTLADLAGDGTPEIVTTVVDAASHRCYPATYTLDGALAWVATDHEISCRAHAPAVADLEGDGDAEVIFDRLLFDADGTLQADGSASSCCWAYDAGYPNGGSLAFAMDVDDDGDQEVVAGGAVFDETGTRVCAAGANPTSGFPAAADFDGDGPREIVVVAGGRVTVYEHDCTTRVAATDFPGAGYGGAPTLADFDGDGVPEIGLAGADSYVVYDVVGTSLSLLWSQPTSDASSSSTGSIVFDFDGNGTAEVVYGDEYNVFVWDGATGTELARMAHDSGTVTEFPTVADVDGDGNAEIVVINSAYRTGTGGIQVYGDAADAWQSAAPVWNQHAWYVDNIAADLSVPTSVDPSAHNSFRQAWPASGVPGAAPDLAVGLWADCDAADDTITVEVQVSNTGLARVGAGVLVSLTGADTTGAWTELHTLTLDEAVEPGQRLTAVTIPFPATTLAGVTRISATVDPADTVRECDEADNTAEVPLGDG